MNRYFIAGAMLAFSGSAAFADCSVGGPSQYSGYTQVLPTGQIFDANEGGLVVETNMFFNGGGGIGIGGVVVAGVPSNRPSTLEVCLSAAGDWDFDVKDQYGFSSSGIGLAVVLDGVLLSYLPSSTNADAFFAASNLTAGLHSLQAVNNGHLSDGIKISTDSITYTSVPEPASLPVLGVGLAGLVAIRGRRNAVARERVLSAA
jgi:hypothetical protein